MAVYYYCDCSAGTVPNSVAQCRACGLYLCNDTSGCKISIQKAIQRQILKQVRVPSSQITNVKGAINIGSEYITRDLNVPIQAHQNMSDRLHPHIQTRYVDRRRTSHKPGQMGPVGTGIDVKHGSYARYLGKLKGPSLATQTTKEPAKIGNKTTNFTLINTASMRNYCKCNGT